MKHNGINGGTMLRKFVVAMGLVTAGLIIGLLANQVTMTKAQAVNMRSFITGIQTQTETTKNFEVAIVFNDGTRQLVGNLSRDGKITVIADDFACIEGKRPPDVEYTVCAPYLTMRLEQPALR